MSLHDLWTKNRTQFQTYLVRQIVQFASDGILKDDSDTAREFREFLRYQDTTTLHNYASQCLNDPFPDSGFVLQDVVNELGRRLDYDVHNGFYRGTPKRVGFDGLWQYGSEHALIVEVKTTDQYRINLDTFVSYRDAILSQGLVDPSLAHSTSILIVVGRQDTGDLEAQVRGSRHAWSVRLISVEALAKLVEIKEESDDDPTSTKIRQLLVPREYTRLDDLIDVLFTTTEDVKSESTLVVEGKEEDDGIVDVDSRTDRSDKPNRHFTLDMKKINEIREFIINKIGRDHSTYLIKKTRAQYWNESRELRVICTLSRRHVKNQSYWYAYHPHWDDFLAQGRTSFLLLGFMDSTKFIALPRNFLSSILNTLNMTIKDEHTKYWHLHVDESESGRFVLRQRGRGKSVDITQFVLSQD